MNSLYNHAWARILRRFVVVSAGAALALLLTRVDTTPSGFVDSFLALSKADWINIAKVGLGAGFLLGIDKLKRELSI